MTSQTFSPPVLRRVAPAVLLAAGLLVPLGLRAQDKPPAPERRTPVAKHASEAGALLARPAKDKNWQAVPPKEAVHSTDLLLSVTGAVVDSKNGAVRLSLLADLTQQSPLPVVESAVVLHESAEADLDFTLDRGRVDVTNRKDKGSAKVRVRFRDESWELTLDEPKTRVVLEYYGRWPAGVGFTAKPKPEDRPEAELYLLVLRGQADVRAGSQQQRLAAPPGPALFHWSSAQGLGDGPERLAKVPDWADPKSPAGAPSKELQATLERVRKRLANQPVATALGGLVDSADTTDRRVAVLGLGAVDEVGPLVEALSHPRREDVRVNAILALRHLIGRSAGQDLKLFNTLVEEKKYSKAHADIVLQLLHSFGETDLGRPETYDLLIAYLKHPRLSVRELARWHLYRLVPAGRTIAYDPAGTEVDRNKAFKQWKALVPDGQLPKKK